MDWQVEDRQPNIKNAEWYLAVGVITLAIALTAIIFSNVLLSILVVVAFVSVVLNHRKQNQTLDISIDSKGIKINDLLYGYDNLESFYIDKDRDLLIVKSKKFFSSHIMIPLIEGIATQDLEELLSKELEQVEMRESVLEQFMEYLGF